MKDSSITFYKLQLLKKDLAYVLMILYVISLPLSFKANGFIIILIGIFVLYYTVYKKQLKIHQNKIILLPILYFILLLFRVDFINYYEKSVQLITLSSTFLLLPIFFLSISISKKRIVILFSIFTGICLLIFLFAILYNLIDFIKSNNLYIINRNGDREFIFYYSHLVKVVGLHPSYISLYISFIICVLIQFNLLNFRTYNWRIKLISIVVILLLMIFVFLLSSRGGILSFFLALISILFVDIVKNFSIKKLFFHIVCYSVLVMSVFQFEYTRTRFQTAINTFITGENKQEIHSSNSRAYILNASVHLTKEVPFFGYGLGRDKEELSDTFRKIGFQKGIDEGFNTHNQYFKILFISGYLGISIWIFIMFSPLYYFRRQNTQYYLIFVILISFNFLFENMLSLQKGVIFFTFFYCLNIAFLQLQKIEKSNLELK